MYKIIYNFCCYSRNIRDMSFCQKHNQTYEKLFINLLSEVLPTHDTKMYENYKLAWYLMIIIIIIMTIDYTNPKSSV